MATCFVIQPFDGGAYDKRFRDVIKPAVEAAGLEAYRVDEDPSVVIPIEDIERGIREASVCLAEITTDNPNIWFELGFAIASRKEVVLICADSRGSKFPFDVQHRSIITYRTESMQDFLDLKDKITTRLNAAIRKEQALGQVVSPMIDVEGLSQHEMVALVSIAENLESPSDSVSAYMIRQDMERAGFTKVATFVALTGLVRKKLIVDRQESDYNGNNFMAYYLTEDGADWLVNNQSKLRLREEYKPPTNPYEASPEDDDIPF